MAAVNTKDVTISKCSENAQRMLVHAQNLPAGCYYGLLTQLGPALCVIALECMLHLLGQLSCNSKLPQAGQFGTHNEKKIKLGMEHYTW